MRVIKKEESILFAYFIVALFALFFSAQAQALTISGTCKQADNVTDCTDTGTIRFATNGTPQLQPEIQSIVAGTWSITGIPAKPENVIITVFIDGATDSQEAVAVFKYDGVGDITGVELIETHLTIGSDDTKGLSNLDLSRYDNSVSGDEDVFHDVNASLELTVDSTGTIPNETLYIKSGYSYSPGGTINTHHVEIIGTLDAGNGNVYVGGNWTNNDVFTAGTSNIIFNGTNNQSITTGGDSFYNLTLDNTGASNSNIVTLQDPLTINNDLLVTRGKLDTSPSNQPITVLGNLNQTATGEIEARASTITVNGDFNADGTLDRSNYNNASLILNGTGNLLYTSLNEFWKNGFNNLTSGQAGQTTTASMRFAIFNKLIVGSGVFTGTADIFLNTTGNAPLNLNPNATISINQLSFFGSNQILPSLPNGYDCNINVSRSGLTLNQTGHITLNAGNDLLVHGSNFPNRAVTYNTNGFNLNVGGSLFLGATSGDTALKTLNISNSNVTVARNFEIRPGTNDLISTNASVTLNGTGAQAVTMNGKSFNELTLDNTGASNSNIVTLQDPLTINNDLLVTRGKLDTSPSNHPITVLGNLNQTATGEIEARASVITVDGDFNANGTLDSTNYNDATIKLVGSGTLTYSNLSASWNNGFRNLIVGQLGQTTPLTSANHFSVKEVLTVGSGVFGNTSSVIYLKSANPLNLDINATIRLWSLRFFGSGFIQHLPPLNNGYDTHISLANNNTQVIQTGNIIINPGKSLLLIGNYSSSRSAHYSTGGFSLNVGKDILVGYGNDTGLKTLDISNSMVTVRKHFRIHNGTNDLISNNSTVTLNGTSSQIVTMNGKGFDQLILTNTSTSGVTFNDGLTANTLTNTTPNSTMTFAAGQDYTINNAVTLQGASGQLLNLISSAPGTHWNFILNAGASKSLSHVNVSWSDASGSHSTQKPIDPSNSTDGGNNIDWFPASELSVTKESTLISDPINGTSANKSHIPGAIVEYRVTVQNSGTASPDANTVIVYDSLDVNVEYDVTTGVVFSDGSTSSAITLGTVSYAHRTSPTVYTYSPTGAFDPNVASIKVETNGAFAFGGSPAPEFSVIFRVRVK